MDKRKELDYFNTANYNENEVRIMQNFMKYPFKIAMISVVTYVPPGEGKHLHINRPFHGIALNCDGKKEYQFENTKTITVGKNDMIYLPKGSSYKVDNISNGGCYAINFDLSEQISFESFLFKPKNAVGIFETLKEAERIWMTKKCGYLLKCMSDLYSILYQIQKEYQLAYVSKSKMNLIEPALKYIEENYTTEEIRVSVLACLCNMSETYFRSIFFNSFGMSPIKYMNQLRIARAKELIASGFYTIHMASELAGFHDDAYFSREFKKATSMNPSQYKLLN